MAQVVDFECVSTSGLESSPVAPGRFKFARQRSKLAGVIRGSFFVIKKEYE